MLPDSVVPHHLQHIGNSVKPRADLRGLAVEGT